MTYIAYDTTDTAIQRSADFWSVVRGAGWRIGNVTQYLYGWRERTGDPESDAGLPDGVDAALSVAERDWRLDMLIVDDEMIAPEAVACAPFYPAWAAGTAYLVDDIVTYGDDLYVVRQSHTAQDDWQPPNVLALYRVYRHNADALLEWITSESVQTGWQRTYAGATYECLQSHVTQSDWQPPNVPALWAAMIEPTAEWQAGVWYTIGDVVTYQGKEYECRQSHTSQPGWEPPNVLALWLPL